MKVILLRDVATVGRQHEVKEVAEGFGRNFLLARGLALAATPANLKKLAAKHERSLAEAKVKQKLLGEALTTLKHKTIILHHKATPEGHLFAGIHAAQIARVLKNDYRLQVPEEAIIIDEPIKTTGLAKVKVKVGELETLFMVDVQGHQ